MADLRPSFESALAAFGLAAVVTLPDGGPVATRAMWLPTDTVNRPAGSDYRRAEVWRVLALPSDDVPQVPRGTVVSVPESEGGESADWSVDEAERIDFDHHRVVVVPA